MVNKERLINTFFDYARIDSESGKEKEIMERLIADLKALGLKVYTDNAGSKCGSTGNNIYCFIDGTIKAEPLLFCAHMDTVKPGIGVEPVIEGEYIRSKGETILGGDDKSGVAVIMEALRVMIEENRPRRPLDIVFTISEEPGLYGSSYLEYDKLRARKAILLDSAGTAGHIKTKAPGLNKLYVDVIGQAAHAGACPEKGVSAIMAAAEAIANMKLLRVNEETTANIGSFIADGTTNIVNPLVRICAETRSFDKKSLDEQTEHMVSCFKTAATKYGATIEYKVVNEFEPYTFPDDHYLVKLVKEKCAKNNIDAFTVFDGGGSDANVFTRHGIESVAIGNGMDRVHSTAEELNIKDFIDAAHIVLSIMTDA